MPNSKSLKEAVSLLYVYFFYLWYFSPSTLGTISIYFSPFLLQQTWKEAALIDTLLQKLSSLLGIQCTRAQVLKASTKPQRSNQANSQMLSGLKQKDWNGLLTAADIHVTQGAKGKVWLVPSIGHLLKIFSTKIQICSSSSNQTSGESRAQNF